MQMKQGFKGVEKRGLKLGGGLSKNQQKILDMLLVDCLTIKAISSYRNCSQQAVYKTVNKLKKKGLISGGLIRGLKKHTTPLPPLHSQNRGLFPVEKEYYRWHGLQYDITIIQDSFFYRESLMKGNQIILDENTCILYKNKIQIYQNIDKSFCGETPERAFSKAILYFNSIFPKLEDRLRITIVKAGSQNIRIASGHCAHVNNGIAKEVNKEVQYINIFGTDDNKAWFKFDRSFKLTEAEAIHPNRAMEDIQKVCSKHLNDWRDNNPPTNSQLNEEIRGLIEVSKNILQAQCMRDIPLEPIEPKRNEQKPFYIG